MQIILASSSARRLELLQSLGFTVTTRAPNVDETPLENEEPSAMVQRLAKAKANAIETSLSCPIIAADTIVYFKKHLLGKPQSSEEAYEMLSLLSGEEHQVVTGYVVKNKNREESGQTITQVSFRHLSKSDILNYIAIGECFGKAGSYAIQGKGASLINQVDGSYTNVIGLPLPDILQALNQVLA